MASWYYAFLALYGTCHNIAMGVTVDRSQHKKPGGRSPKTGNRGPDHEFLQRTSAALPSADQMRQ